MFTGLVEELGTVLGVEHRAGGARLRIGAQRVLEDAVLGASIAVDGCCLTVVELGEGWWEADAVVETMGRTTLGSLRPGDGVNLERPLRLSDRLGGHLVQGHVDGVGEATARREEPDGSFRLAVGAPAGLCPYLVEKGAVAVDGVSLTVAALVPSGFEVAVVPHTARVTTLGRRRPGDRMNLEVDLVAKYVESLAVPFLARAAPGGPSPAPAGPPGAGPTGG